MTGAQLPEANVAAPEPVSLRELVGNEPTLLVFFKESCSTCQIALPVFQHWAPQVRVLGIAQDEPEITAAFFAEHGVEMEVAFDAPNYEASSALDIEAVPAMYLVNDGNIEWSSVGWNVDRATELAGRIGELAHSDPVLIGADSLPPFRPG